MELQEAISTFRHWTTQANQAAGVVATADAALIAYALQMLVGTIFVASVMPAMMLLAYMQAMSTIVPIILLALELERKLQIRQDSLLRLHAPAFTCGRLHRGWPSRTLRTPNFLL